MKKDRVNTRNYFQLCIFYSYKLFVNIWCYFFGKEKTFTSLIFSFFVDTVVSSQSQFFPCTFVSYINLILSLSIKWKPLTWHQFFPKQKRYQAVKNRENYGNRNTKFHKIQPWARKTISTSTCKTATLNVKKCKSEASWFKKY